jgi:hypothetical protein
MSDIGSVGPGLAVLGIVLAPLFVQNSRPAAGDHTLGADAGSPWRRPRRKVPTL